MSWDWVLLPLCLLVSWLTRLTLQQIVRTAPSLTDTAFPRRAVLCLAFRLSRRAMEALAGLYPLQDRTILWGLGAILLLVLLLLSAALLFLYAPFLSGETSLQLTYILFQILWTPIAMIFHLTSDVSELQGTTLSMRISENWWTRCCKSPMLRQALFVLVMMGFERVMMISLSACWCCIVWLFSYLSNVLYTMLRTDGASSSFEELGTQTAACLAILGALLNVTTHHSAVEVCGCMAFLALTNTHLQNCLLSLCGQARLQRLEGLDEDYLLGTMMVADIFLCLVLALLSLRQHSYLLATVALVNVSLGGLNFRRQVWQPLQEKLGRMRGLRRASWRELQEHNDVCPVCLTAMWTARVTSCGHLFHGCCLRQSLEVSPRCPICKTVIDQPG